MAVKFKLAVAIGLAATLLSACVETGPRMSGPSMRSQAFADGNWNQGQVANYIFSNGGFVGTAVDTGNKVAQGTYQYTSVNTIQISSYSEVQKKTIVANCLLVNTRTMNCTADTGSQFSLVRAF